MIRTIHYVLAFTLSIAIAPSETLGAKSGNHHLKQGRDAQSNNDSRAGAAEEKWERDPIVFSTRDREAIRNYYGICPRYGLKVTKHHGGLQSGKLLQRNGTVPPGLQNRFEPLPGDVERRLQSLYSGYSRGTMGADLVIVEDRTQRIMDIIRNVTGRR